MNLVPNKGMRAAAKKGLEWVRDGYAGDGLEPATVDRARKIARGEELTPKHVRRMHSFFERHASGRSKKRTAEVTPWDVAWSLWGGDAGRKWSAQKVEQMKP